MDKFKRILEVERRTWKKQFFRVLIILIFVFSSLAVIGLFDFERISTGIPAVLKLLPEMFPLISQELELGLNL